MRNPNFYQHPSPGLPITLRRSLSVLAVAMLLLLFAWPGSVQAQAPGSEGYWKQHFAAQVRTLIQSNDPGLREQGMELIIQFQNQNDASFDFSPIRSQLYSIFFDRKNTEEQRILALSALFATDSEKTARILAEWVEDEPSQRVRRHVMLALDQLG